MKRESAADSLSMKSIKKFVKGQFVDERAKSYSSGSLRKGAMTENRANHDLSRTQEEYARSGHVAPDQNPNKRGTSILLQQ